MVGEDLQDGASLSPGPGGLACLVLDGHGGADCQGREGPGAMVELLLFQDMSLGEGSSTLVSSESPLRAGSELARLDREEIPQNSSKQDLGR